MVRAESCTILYWELVYRTVDLFRKRRKQTIVLFDIFYAFYCVVRSVRPAFFSCFRLLSESVPTARFFCSITRSFFSRLAFRWSWELNLTRMSTRNSRVITILENFHHCFLTFRKWPLWWRVPHTESWDFLCKKQSLPLIFYSERNTTLTFHRPRRDPENKIFFLMPSWRDAWIQTNQTDFQINIRIHLHDINDPV